MTAASDIVKQASARPPYIGLPCSARPGVPSLTSKSTISASSIAQCGWDPPVLEGDALRAAAPQAEQGAPVVEHRELAARRDEQQHPLAGLPSSRAISACPM